MSVFISKGNISSNIWKDYLTRELFFSWKIYFLNLSQIAMKPSETIEE